MKMIVAVIKPFKLDDVRDALAALGVQGLTVTEVRGFGRQRGHTDLRGHSPYEINFIPKLKLEIGVSDGLADKVVEVIRREANTDNIGDGKIFVYDLLQAVRIRTGESGDSAL